MHKMGFILIFAHLGNMLVIFLTICFLFWKILPVILKQLLNPFLPFKLCL